MIVAAELGTGLRITSGPVIERSGDLAADPDRPGQAGDVLFIDEIHRIAKPAEELLYSAMEDFRVDVVVGKGPGATAIPLDVEPFTLVGATTRAGLLTGPMRDRFGFVAHLDFYRRPSWTRCCSARPGSSAWRSPTEGAAEIAGRSRGTPRIANRLLRRVRDYAEVRGDGVVTGTRRARRCRCTTWTTLGLDRLDRAVLRALIDSFRGGPVRLVHAGGGGGGAGRHGRGGVRAIPGAGRAAGPYAAGRVATAAGWAHLGRTPPPTAWRVARWLSGSEMHDRGRRRRIRGLVIVAVMCAAFGLPRLTD